MNCLPKLHSITVTNTYRSNLTFMDPVQVQVQVRLSATFSLSWRQVPLRAHVYCCEWLCSASTVIHNNRLVSSYQINAHFLYSITVYMLHYNPQHVSSSTLLIFRRTNCIITASGIVTVCKRPYSMPVESGLQSALDRHTIRPFTDSDDTRGCNNIPEDEQGTARNMLRIIM
jgi:hypothetical protein